MKKANLVIALALGSALALSACGTDDSGQTGATKQTGQARELVTLTIGASPTPHGEILRFVAKNLATEAGLKLEIEEFGDYVLPNKGLDDGSLDANYFQHLPYLESQVAEFGYDFHPFEGVHIEPLGVYSDKHQNLDNIPQGAKIGVSNDPANQARALRLLETAKVFTLKDTGDKDPTIADLADNPHGVELTQLDPQLLPKSLQDFDFAVINGNFAIDAGINPANDNLKLEHGEDNPYANMLVVRTADKDRPELVKLDQLLHSDEVRKFIETKWTDGAVIPAF